MSVFFDFRISRPTVYSFIYTSINKGIRVNRNGTQLETAWSFLKDANTDVYINNCAIAL